MAPEAFYHPDSEAVRVRVSIDDVLVGASIRKAVLHHRFTPQDGAEARIEIYARHAAEIEAAVRRRVAQGSIERVMLREHDLRPRRRMNDIPRPRDSRPVRKSHKKVIVAVAHKMIRLIFLMRRCR